MNDYHDQTPPLSPGSRKKDRIETQIHRRRTAVASSPLKPEWDISQPGPPSQLRMSPLRKTPPASLKQPVAILDRSVPDQAIAKPKR